ncbi:FAD-dependent monooxygenase [Streptomyces sp. bgisy100]|uniref:FAD-dependent monooxygenase n=1 Tax=Streptomyces sp. bgisy100 TaxID=3413783 RepID=UPI003D72FF81
MTTVLIVGAGPTGLTLACDLARRGTALRIIDRTPEHARTSRAKGPNPRSLEVLEDLGVLDAVLAAGSAPMAMRKYRNGRWIADSDPFETSRPTPDAPYDRGRIMAQWQLERILRDRLAEYGVHVEPGAELTGLAQDGTGVTAELADGSRITARYLVGCDGGHSTTRKLLGVPMEGETATDQSMVCGDVVADGPERDRWHQWFDEDGAVMMCPIPGTRSGWWFQAAPERDADGNPVAPSLESFQRLCDRHTGAGVRLTEATLLSTYRVNVRMVDRYRVGRVFLAGDAAHVHSIAGGLGMNTGIQDAHNLGWKLALVTAGQAGPGLLDTYQEERLPVAAWTLDITSAGMRAVLEAIRKPGGGLEAGITPETSALGLGYRWSSLSRDRSGRTGTSGAPDLPADALNASSRAPAGDGADTRLRPGDRAPDAPCRDTATGTPRRLFEVFAGPHFTLLGFGAGSTAALRDIAAERGDTVRVCAVDAGPQAAPGGNVPGLDDHGGHARSAYGTDGDGLVLVRPDNHVGLLAPADGIRAVRDYLDGLGR